MKPSFMILRNDGKTDSVYDCDFKEGKFVGGASTYGYSDITTFYLPSQVVEGFFAEKEAYSEPVQPVSARARRRRGGQP